MQRQIRFLRHASPARRGGFILIMAVFLIIIISAMALKMLSYSSENTQQVINDYLYEQAALLGYGATEYTMLAISGTNPAAGCVTDLDMTYPEGGPTLFNINTTVQYIWTAPAPAGCAGATVQTVQTPEQNGIAIVTVTVETAPGVVTEPIRFYRQTLQKL